MVKENKLAIEREDIHASLGVPEYQVCIYSKFYSSEPVTEAEAGLMKVNILFRVSVSGKC